jgi:hypothetical protein
LAPKLPFSERKGNGRIPPGAEGPAPNGTLWNARDFSLYIARRLILAQADIDRVSQEIVGRPSQIGDLADQLRLNPVNTGENERRTEAG